MLDSLRCRCNQTPVSNICEAVPISLTWVPYGLNKLLEMHFEFPFNLVGKSTTAFLTGQSWHVLKSQYTGGGSAEQGVWCCFADGLNLSLVLSVAQARLDLTNGI